MTYARYIYTIKHYNNCGSLIPEGYEVDHVDNDNSNDRIGNLQLLTKVDNFAKRNANILQELADVICPICGKITTIHASRIRGNLRKLRYCSYHCGVLGQQHLNPGSDRYNWLKDHQIIHTYRDYVDSRWVTPRREITYTFSDVIPQHPIPEIKNIWSLKDISEKLIDIVACLDNGMTHARIAAQYKVATGDIRNIIHKHLPTYTHKYKLTNINKQILNLLDSGMPIKNIAIEVGYSRMSVHDIIIRNFPWHSSEFNKEKYKRIIREMFWEANKTSLDISNELRISQDAVAWYLQLLH